MRRILLGLAAATGLACFAAPAMAHEPRFERHYRPVHVRVERWPHHVYAVPPTVYVTPAPVYVNPAPVYVNPAPVYVPPGPAVYPVPGTLYR